MLHLSSRKKAQDKSKLEASEIAGEISRQVTPSHRRLGIPWTGHEFYDSCLENRLIDCPENSCKSQKSNDGFECRIGCDVLPLECEPNPPTGDGIAVAWGVNPGRLPPTRPPSPRQADDIEPGEAMAQINSHALGWSSWQPCPTAPKIALVAPAVPATAGRGLSAAVPKGPRKISFSCPWVRPSRMNYGSDEILLGFHLRRAIFTATNTSENATQAPIEMISGNRIMCCKTTCCASVMLRL